MIAPDLETITCPICSNHQSTLFYSSRDFLGDNSRVFHYTKCDSCSCVYLNPRVKKEKVSTFYQNDSYVPHLDDSKKNLSTLILNFALYRQSREKDNILKETIRLDLDQTLSIADIGCGNGSFLKFLSKKYPQHHYFGYDYYTEQSGPGIEFTKCDLDHHSFPENKFDLITLWHVLEHSYDPAALIKKCTQSLKPNGILAIEVPRLDSLSSRWHGKFWPGILAPQHTALFTKDTLEKITTGQGLRKEIYFSFGSLPVYYYLFCGFVFRILKNGFNLKKWGIPYIIGYIFLFPLVLLKKTKSRNANTHTKKNH